MSSEIFDYGKKLQKICIEFDDPTGGLMQYQQENLKGDGLETILLPFDLNIVQINYIKVKLYEKASEEPVIVDGLEKLRYLVFGSAYKQTPELQEWKRRERIVDSLMPEYFQQSAENNGNFPTARIEDVTERDMFGYEAIPETKLGDKGGIWAWHGLRKLEFKVDGLPFDEKNKGADEKQCASMYFFKVGANNLDNVLNVREIRYNVKRGVYVVYLNTNRLGEELKEVDDAQPTFSGRFEIHLYNRTYKTVYSFPVEICVHNTQLDDEMENHLLDDLGGVVSIDFGTSSTCAAVRGTGLKELITLSGEGKSNANASANQYENPTNLMIYSWDEFYHQWEHSNKNCPFLVTMSEELELTATEVDYDSGYTVNEILKEINTDVYGMRRARSAISELKTIPSMPAEKRQQIKIRPFNSIDGKIVYVTDSFEDENDSTLDPIAFYGYLLSRAINNPVRQKIYTTYLVSFPVKFEKTVRDKICDSLAYGIRRALPTPIAEAKDEDGEPFVQVQMIYEESVACIGAIVGNQLVIDEENPTAKPFAIFDLGGGTLDTSYGIFRDARDDEEAAATIQIFGCGGNNRSGGEKLIHQLAYKIYLDNRDTIEAHQIPFVIPEGMKRPQGFQGLLDEIGDEISNGNVNTLKEKLARTLFQYSGIIDNQMQEIFGGELAEDATTFKITLFDKFNKKVEDILLNVTGIDDFLEQKIRNLIAGFKADMDTICKTPKVEDALRAAGIDGYRPEDFAIFLGGNASKQRYVEEKMREIFPNNRIERITSVTDSQEDLSDCYRLNSKTAVAFGQLDLEDYFIDKSLYQTGDGEGAPFPFNVGYKDPKSGKFIVVIAKGNNDLSWSCANLLGKTDNKTQLLFTDDPQCDPITLRPFNKKIKAGKDRSKQYLWIRVAPDAHESIEYRIGGKNENFSADEPMDETKVFKLVAN